MGKIQVFLDTDVIVSALLSKTGVSFAIIQSSGVKKTISTAVKKEFEEVIRRLDLDVEESQKLLKSLKIISLNLTRSIILKNCGEYVLDEKDSHVVAGAKKAKSKFLLTHNVRHYKINKINTDLGIIVYKPGNFLQYLRSLGEL